MVDVDDEGCSKLAELALFQVVGDAEAPTLLPAGGFCGEHCASEKALREKRGETMAIKAIRAGENQRCCWLPEVPPPI